jgi:DNA replication protein DnaC
VTEPKANSLDGATHESRISQLRLARAPVESALVSRVRSHYYSPRSVEQVARDEAAIAALETLHAAAIGELRARERGERLDAFRVPLTCADTELVARDQLDPTRVVKMARSWLATDKPLLVLSGPPGRGKTVAAADALVRVSGRYTRAGDVARLFLAQFGDEVREREALIRERHLLVVDDVGTEMRPDAMGVALIEMLDARRRGQRTLWVTNLSRGDFEGRYDDSRLRSRMAQSAVWCVDNGPDMRRGAA